jgi:hypothetical protein
MANFSASDAAFAGFAFVRRRPQTVAIWAIALLVVSMGFSALILNQFGPLLDKLATVPPETLQDPTKAMAIYRQFLPLEGDAFLFSLVFYPIVFAAMNRAVLRPGESRFGYLRLGADELRQLGLMVSFIVLGIGAEIIVIIGVTILSVFVGVLTHVASQNDGLTLLSVLVVYLIMFGLCVFAGVRLSLASAQTFATRRINIFGSWTLTKGRFWPIFGAYVLATFLAIIVMLLGYVIVVAMMAMTGGANPFANVLAPGHAAPAEPYSLGAMLSLPHIIRSMLVAALSAITWPVVMLPAPTIYQAIVGDAGASADVV